MRPTSGRRKTGGRRVIQTTGQGGVPAGRYKTRQGIERNPREPLAPGLPMTDRHKLVLACLEPVTPTSAKAIADQLDLKYSQVSSALNAIQARGFATKLPNRRGWIRDGL